MASANLHVTAGRPYPLGAAWDGEGTNFALFSANATLVELCLFSVETGREVAVEEVKHVLAEEFRTVFADSAVAAGGAAQG